MTDTLIFLETIPGAVWGVIGAVTGAALTSITNLISNYGNNKRLSLQLAHDAKEKNIDRMNNLRREIYMAAIEQMTKASSYFSSIPYREISDQNVSSGLEGLYVAAAKLSLVAPPGTQEAVDRLGVEYWQLTRKVVGWLSPMQELKAEMNLHSVLYEQAMTEVKRLISSMNSLRESGRVDEGLMHGLEKSFEFLSNQATDHTEQRHEANLKFDKLCSEYHNELMLDLKPLAVIQAKVVIAIRKDLGVETDEARMMSHLEQHWEIVSADVAKSKK